SLSCRRLLLEPELRPKARQVAPDSGYGKPLAVAPIGDRTVMRGGIAVDINAIPLLRVAHVVDGQIVMLGPEKRHCRKALPLPEDIPRCHHALALGEHPVFNADALARSRVGPARNIARRIDA